jgi:hypothetical protein
VIKNEDYGDLWQLADETAQWQLLDVPETVSAK